MDAIQEFLDLNLSKGMVINGIKAQRIPGRGIGFVASRKIRAGTTILEVPSSLLKNISTIPKSTTRKLPRDMSVAGLLALDICRDASPDFAKWRAVMPSRVDVEASLPLTWDPRLQALLPPAARKNLEGQKAKFALDWSRISAAFPEDADGGDGGGGTGGGPSRAEYMHAWLLVNSRTFYHVTPRTRHRPKEDHMAMQPIADLFNHAAEGGCAVAFDSKSYTFQAARDYARGDEVFVSYGRHSNDLLLVDYGFFLAENRWDEADITDLVLAELGEAERERLEEVGFLGKYVLDSEGVCFRTKVALRAKGTTKGEFIRFVVEGEDSERVAKAARERLAAILNKHVQHITSTMEEIESLGAGTDFQREMLRDRWAQILDLVRNAAARAD